MGDSSESLVLGLGYLPTPPDVTKKLAGIKLVKKPAVLPKHVDFSGDMKPPKYQNGWASCVPFGLLGALDSATLPDTYSEAYNWYKTKQLHGFDPHGNSGVNVHVAISVMQKQGTCWESSCVYPTDPDHRYPKYDWPEPSDAANKEALKHKIADARFLIKPVDKDAVRMLLAAKTPVVIGFSMFGDPTYWKKWIWSDECLTSGVVPMPPEPVPDPTDGHCVSLVGYDDDKKLFKFKNSWGRERGKDGWFWMPYEYFEKVDQQGNPYITDAIVFTPGQEQPAIPSLRAMAETVAPDAIWKHFAFTDGEQPSGLV
ncbi:hypothetical protein BDV37DRAFT_280598 [Aspergillus pseudonomiae]|uniref:Peptidase C1A papain C-terminal domain-containing protein n=1 Tax=Aspergillus pseudonomiae TaxID=1506151 RepID=A0A5N7DKK8_9EURO|nr:uncharacterized protein BDV37DRAFT_280598 [Aspergillus pseudonomiae]KAE8406639.1 hypothetical protein BDV37DRAFT_280598 [Aspergillus pseudonomiae]